jgi:heat shock protein HtpX
LGAHFNKQNDDSNDMEKIMLKNQLKTIFLLGSLSALLISIGALVAPGALYLFVGLAVLMNLGAYFFSDRIVLRMHGAQEVSRHEAPTLHAMVEELAHRAEIPKPKVYLIDESQPNAFATGRNPAHGVVAVTRGLMHVLDQRELRGVLAHEIAHIKNRDILISSIAATVAAVISYIGQALSFSSLFGSSSDEEGTSSSGGGLLAAIVAPIAALWIQMGISRSREYMADETGARLSGDPEALASALLKLQQTSNLVPSNATPATASLFIVNPFGAMESFSRLFSTHPHTEDRVRRLMAMSRTRVRPQPYMHRALFGE